MPQIMIDRVAKAIYEAHEHHCAWEASTIQYAYRERAIAAIKAMREPTDKMICRVLDENDKRRTTFTEDYKLMIDEALNEDN